jgi:hypothetical protein
MKAVLCLIVILASTAPLSAKADITTDLIAWYSFDGNLADSSGNTNHGSPIGDLLLTTDRFGAPDMAYEFNGLNSYILIPNSTSLSSPDSALTQAAWVLFYGPSRIGQAFGPITMKSASSPNSFMYRMTATPGAGTSVAFNNWLNSYGTSYDFLLSQWYHVASVFDGTAVQFYVNGARVDSVAAPTTIVPSVYNMTIGGDVPGILEIFWGKIDDVRIYSRALTDGDIAELCDCPATGVNKAPALSASAIRRTYPNPSGGDTSVDFFVESSGNVELTVYDVAGRLVRTLHTGALARGEHAANWDGRNAAGKLVPSGVYFLRLNTGGVVVSSRLVRIR